jgi:exopolysaccharide biosynthesis polyprenyl glycosylphosphotransferase
MPLLLLLDVLFLVVAGVIAVATRFVSVDVTQYIWGHIDGIIIFISSIVLSNYLSGAYQVQTTFARLNVVVTWIFSIVFSVLVLSITSYAWFSIMIGRGVLILLLVWYSVFTLTFRLLFSKRLFRSGFFLCRAIVIAPRERIAGIRATLESKWTLPAHKIVACVELDNTGRSSTEDGMELFSGVPVVRTSPQKLEDILRGLDPGLIVISMGGSPKIHEVYPRLRRLRLEGIEVIPEHGAVELYAGRIPLEYLNEDFLMEITLESRIPFVAEIKRVVDLVTSLLALIFLSPVMLLVALLVKISNPLAPVLYIQDRVGQFGKVFRIIKFRTMKPDAEAESGATWAEDGDPRITRLGSVLRKTRLDELPQFWNVFKGDMSLVGPRPERPELTKKLEIEIPFFEERYNILPGLTGWAQIRYPYGNSVEDARRKLEYDLYYMRHMSLALDLQIMLSTIRIMLLGKERRA